MILLIQNNLQKYKINSQKKTYKINVVQQRNGFCRLEIDN